MVQRDIYVYRSFHRDRKTLYACVPRDGCHVCDDDDDVCRVCAYGHAYHGRGGIEYPHFRV